VGAFSVSRFLLIAPYKRPAFNVEEQFAHLKELGMAMPELSEFQKHIRSIGYYRLKAYMLPFRNPDRTFLDNTKFDDVIDIYRFDQGLRNLIFSRIQDLEVIVRTQFNEHMVASYDCAFWYIRDEILFEASEDFKATLEKVENHFGNSKEEFAQYYRARFHNIVSEKHKTMPPTWMAIELMTFGNLVTFMNGLPEEVIKDCKLDRFAKKNFGVNKFRTLTNWLLCVRDVRNHTAHHGRLFNRNLRALNGILPFLEVAVPEIEADGRRLQRLNRIYTALAGIQVMCDKQNMMKIGPDISNLVRAHPSISQFFDSMGFPHNWENEPRLF
jgi:abortive infection bacteriophage resistance protein